MKTSSRDGSEIRLYRNVIGRRALPRDPPLSIDPAKEIFFITICCKQRGKNQLCHSDIASVLFDAAKFYEDKRQWFIPVMVLMPDHVRFLASFASDAKITDLVARWKRFTSTHAKIQWQRDFFDHRLRGDEGWHEKGDYILQKSGAGGVG